MHTQVFFAFGVYFAILLLIGLMAHKKHTTEADFILGNRSLNFWVTAISAHASDMSNWLFMSFPMAIYMGGLPKAWLAVGLILGMFLSWQFVAPKLRVATEQLNSFTLSSFFERRFHDYSGLIRFVSAVMTLLFMIHYLAAGLTGMGFIFESMFYIDYYIGISIATTVIALYTFVGGYITVAWTDLFQGLFLLVAIIIVPLVAFLNIDGMSAIESAAATRKLSLSFFPDFTLMTFVDILLLMLGWGLGYFGQLHIMTKFMGIKDPTQLNKSKYLGMSWQLIALSSATMVGFIGIGYFNTSLDNPELIFVEMVRQLFNPFIGGLILCGILAAAISTMDSQILVSTGVLTEDIYKQVFKRSRASSNELLLVSRFSVLLTALVAYTIALDKSQTVMDMVYYSWTGLGCSFGPVVLTSLYYKNANRYGAVAGIVTGGLIAATWDRLNPLLIDYPIPGMIPGFFLALFMIIVVSAITPKHEPSPSHQH